MSVRTQIGAIYLLGGEKYRRDRKLILVSKSIYCFQFNLLLNAGQILTALFPGKEEEVTFPLSKSSSPWEQ